MLDIKFLSKCKIKKRLTLININGIDEIKSKSSY